MNDGCKINPKVITGHAGPFLSKGVEGSQGRGEQKKKQILVRLSQRKLSVDLILLSYICIVLFLNAILLNLYHSSDTLSFLFSCEEWQNGLAKSIPQYLKIL